MTIAPGLKYCLRCCEVKEAACFSKTKSQCKPCRAAMMREARKLKTSTLLQKVNAGDFPGAANEFHKWIHSDGQVSRGLIRRREAEEALFTTPEAQ